MTDKAMTVNELRTLLRTNGFPSATVLFAAADDGRTVGSPSYDLFARTEGAYQAKLGALTGELRRTGWVA